jgi:sugar lactone lactonase YvrE
MLVGADGGAYVGNFGFDLGREPPRATGLVHVAPDGSTRRVADGLLFPNGMVLHDRTLIVAETWAARLTEFTVASDGSLSERRAFAVVPRSAPDGCALDVEGCIWFADARSNRCVRVARGAGVVEVVTVPNGLRCFACMLGGAEGRTLAICAAAGYGEDRPHDAVVLAAQVDVPHAGLP